MTVDRFLTDLAMEREVSIEKETRRIAGRRELTIVCYPSDCEVPGDPVELHLIEPRNGQCIAVRSSWAWLRVLLIELTPVYRRQLLARGTPCALHPQPPAPHEEP